MTEKDETPAQAMASRIRAAGEDPDQMLARLRSLDLPPPRQQGTVGLEDDVEMAMALKEMMLKAYIFTGSPWTLADERAERALMEWFQDRVARRPRA